MQRLRQKAITRDQKAVNLEFQRKLPSPQGRPCIKYNPPPTSQQEPSSLCHLLESGVCARIPPQKRFTHDTGETEHFVLQHQKRARTFHSQTFHWWLLCAFGRMCVSDVDGGARG